MVWGYPMLKDWQEARQQDEEMKRLLQSEAFYEGIQIDGVSVGGHTFDEVVSALEERDRNEKDSVQVKLSYNGINYVLSGEDAGMMFNSRAIAEEAYALGRTGSTDERRDEIKRLEVEEAVFNTSRYYDKASVLSFIVNISDYILADVDVDALCEQVYAALDDRRYTQTVPIEATVRENTENEAVEMAWSDTSDNSSVAPVGNASGQIIVVTPAPNTSASGEEKQTPEPEPTPAPLPEQKTVKLHKSDWVNVRDIIPSMEYNIIRATENNAFKTIFYSIDACILRAGTAAKLKEAQKLAQQDGYTIMIYDAYRPLSAQKKMFEILPDTRYVANPANGSRHNRGAAVDITLLKDGMQVDMPSAYEVFSDASHRTSKLMTGEQRENMNYLTKIMEKCGFTTISTEWWHYDDADYKNYPISDASFEELLAQMNY